MFFMARLFIIFILRCFSVFVFQALIVFFPRVQTEYWRADKIFNSNIFIFRNKKALSKLGSLGRLNWKIKEGRVDCWVRGLQTDTWQYAIKYTFCCFGKKIIAKRAKVPIFYNNFSLENGFPSTKVSATIISLAIAFTTWKKKRRQGKKKTNHNVQIAIK